ncbi:MAG: hypothetical protein FWG70_08325 [Oscillospiraceae bacterium]|nr:hypothetical protein [Oscillospiraceae bacterium]
MEKSFNYTYSAKQQEEVKSIRQRYEAHEESKIELLRKLDSGAKKKGTIAAITLGVFGSLLLGTGMACVTEWTNFFALGIIVGIIGMAVMAPAYPLYLSITKKQREKIAPQILQLSKELMQN